MVDYKSLRQNNDLSGKKPLELLADLESQGIAGPANESHEKINPYDFPWNTAVG